MKRWESCWDLSCSEFILPPLHSLPATLCVKVTWGHSAGKSWISQTCSEKLLGQPSISSGFEAVGDWEPSQVTLGVVAFDSLGQSSLFLLIHSPQASPLSARRPLQAVLAIELQELTQPVSSNTV